MLMGDFPIIQSSSAVSTRIILRGTLVHSRDIGTIPLHGLVLARHGQTYQLGHEILTQCGVDTCHKEETQQTSGALMGMNHPWSW